MTTLKETINKDFIEAMKEKNDSKKGTLSFLKAKLIDAEKANKNTPLNEEETLNIILKSIKQREQSIIEFSKANRTDLVDKETKELSFLQVYLPKQMTKEELKTKALEVLSTIPPSDNINKTVGMVMGSMNKQYKGMFDINELKTILAEIVK